MKINNHQHNIKSSPPILVLSLNGKLGHFLEKFSGPDQTVEYSDRGRKYLDEDELLKIRVGR